MPAKGFGGGEEAGSGSNNAKSLPLARLEEDSTAYQLMLGELLPRGPIWDIFSNAGLGGLMAGLGVEAVRLHNRIVDLMLEAYPSTADELLDEWEEVYGLPFCDDVPPTDDLRRAALAARVKAQGGQSPSYYIELARTILGDPNANVTVEEFPNGVPFRVSVSRVQDRLVSVSEIFSWVLHVPSTTTADQLAIIECLIEHYKPAHTVATVEDDL